jgi:hypothetical protein
MDNHLLIMFFVEYLEFVEIPFDIPEHIINTCEKRQIRRPVEIFSEVDKDHKLVHELIDDAIVRDRDVVDDSGRFNQTSEDANLSFEVVFFRRSSGYDEAMREFREQIIDRFIIGKSVYGYEQWFILSRDDR